VLGGDQVRDGHLVFGRPALQMHADGQNGREHEARDKSQLWCHSDPGHRRDQRRNVATSRDFTVVMGLAIASARCR